MILHTDVYEKRSDMWHKSIDLYEYDMHASTFFLLLFSTHLDISIAFVWPGLMF